MPTGQIESFADLLAAWGPAERESDKRALWRMLTRGGWFRVCQDAVRKEDYGSLQAWLDARDPILRDIIQFNGEAAAQLVYTHLLCALAACQARKHSLEEQQKTLRAAISFLAPPLGFCRDLIQAFLDQPLRKAERELTLTALLVDAARNEGVVSTLTLELLSDGNGDLYPVPELVFIRAADFRQAEENARVCVSDMKLWRHNQDVRWRLQRLDGKPLVNLSGPSMSAAFALGIAKLCAND